MSLCEITIPQSLDLQNTLIFSNHLYDLPEADEYVFNFQNLEWFEPFSLLYLSSEIQLIRDKYSTKKFKAINHLTKSYAGHMGFFKAFGCNFGNIPGQTAGNRNYIPITIYNCELLRREAAKGYEKVGQFIENNASKAASLLTRTNSGEIYDVLTYSIREIIRNVIEHSESKRFGFVEMKNQEDGLKAIEELDGCEYDKSTIVVKKAEPKADTGNRGPRPGAAGGNRGKFSGPKRF